MYAKQIGSYQKSEVLTADPMRLVLMCYKATIKNLKSAKVKYQEKEFEAKAKAIQKAVDLISELILGLDFEKGGNIARNLSALYHYMIRQINLGDVNEELGKFDEVIGLLSELEDAWKQAVAGKRDTIDTVDEGRKQIGAFA